LRRRTPTAPLHTPIPCAVVLGLDIDDTSTEFVASAYAGVETYTNSFDPPLKYADGE